LNAITDVAGVRVGSVTLVDGEGPLVVGRGPVRTGVTVIVPHEQIGVSPVFAGTHTLNGNGEMTGLEWVRESGQLTTAIAITNTHSVGTVRDALVAADMAERNERGSFWSLPVVAETYDGALNDINGIHVSTAHVHEALANASGGPVAEGGVGGGTGMICHEFKGGTGTASRVVGSWRVGALTSYKAEGAGEPLTLSMLHDGAISDLFWGAIESTEEAICNALVAAETMTGRDGITAYALPHDALVAAMTKYGRGPAVA
jgi:L-aminopeptidase/D-esterase-like protein